MIKGIGTDIIEINRIKKAIERESFLTKYFTENERQQFLDKKNRAETIAGVFSAKEAVVKAMGTGFSGFSSSDIEILKDEKGKPFVNVFNNAKEICNKKGIDVIHVSITHCKDYAQSFAVAEGGL